MSGMKIIMVKSKDKGSRWERDAVKILNDSYYGTWKRVPGSGAFGTILEIDELRGDLAGNYYFLPFIFRGEAKTGYGGATQIAVKRKWFEKIREEAESGLVDEVPLLICKFSGSRSDMRYFISMDFEALGTFLDAVEELYQENIRLRGYLEDNLYDIEREEES